MHTTHHVRHDQQNDHADQLGTDAPGLDDTLTSADYCDPAVFDLERRQIFHAGWMYVCHVDALPAGTRRVFDIAGESVIVARDRAGEFHAFANVCRHRGSELCPAGVDASTGNIRCGYHAWTYSLDGALVATPRVDDEFDRGDYGLWAHHAAVWNGLVFVSVAEQPPSLASWLARWSPGIDDFAGVPVADYRIGVRTEAVVAANWKILIENYNECLHCAVVHPELVEVIPLYRSGHVVDPDRDDEIVDLRPGARALTADGRTTLSMLPGIDPAAEYSGLVFFPNLEFDLTPTTIALTSLFPVAPDRTVVVAEYLFSPADVERADFDPSPEVDLNELVGAQDFAVCEMVQRGVSSRAFAGGGLTAKDAYVTEFVQRYLDIRGSGANY
jgi:Rieske 2Fe-2S family protein